MFTRVKDSRKAVLIRENLVFVVANRDYLSGSPVRGGGVGLVNEEGLNLNGKILGQEVLWDELTEVQKSMV